MSTTKPGLRDQASLRTTFRVLGVILLVAGLALLGTGIASVLSAMGSDSASFPSHVWMAFVGLLVVGFALMCLQAGFLGAASRYAAGETAPVLKDSAAYLSDGAGILGVGRTADERRPGSTGLFCSQCGSPHGPGATFCEQCGRRFAR